jgi:NADPH-dependent ferric siderophore reductase
MSQSKPQPPKNATMIVADVVRVAQVTPGMIRVTLGGDSLAAFEPQGFDQWFRLFLPLQGETNFALPKKIDLLGYVQYLAMPKATRPPMRNYTVRAFRADERELDIDFVAHGDEGIASGWAARAEVGDRLALLDQGVMFNPAPDTDWHLLAAEESGLPAVAGILRDLPRDARGHAFIEIPSAADAQETGAPDGFDVHWIVRAAGTRPGTAALEAVQALDFPAGTVSAFVVGEQALATGLRRWLVTERSVPKTHVTFCGFWRVGAAH